MDKIIAQLLAQGTSEFVTDYGAKYRITFSRPHDFIDLIVANEQEPMGFITIKDEGRGKYSIVNDTEVNEHPSFINTPGHGIEVKKKYRKRGIGGWLISLAISLIKQDRMARKKAERFMIVASDITKEGVGCYLKFGFTIREGMSVSAAYYVSIGKVPQKYILLVRASFLKRLRLRLKSRK